MKGSIQEDAHELGVIIIVVVIKLLLPLPIPGLGAGGWGLGWYRDGRGGGVRSGELYRSSVVEQELLASAWECTEETPVNPGRTGLTTPKGTSKKINNFHSHLDKP